MADELIIKSKEQFDNVMKERREKSDKRQVRTEAVRTYNHAEVASQVIKVVNSLPMDPFAKKVLTLRVIGPLINGIERSHLSIAMELGATIDDVVQAESYGIDFVSKAMSKFSMPDFIKKFNADKKLDNAIRGEINKGQPRA